MVCLRIGGIGCSGSGLRCGGLRGAAPRVFGGERAEGATGRESEIALNGQTRAKELEDRVLAKAKESDGVMAVLEE